MAPRVSVFVLCAALSALLGEASGHSYHLGSCPIVEPVADFDYARFAGKWYAVQETSSSTRCLTYRYDSDDKEPPKGVYRLEKSSEHHSYTGTVTKTEGATSAANMTQRFPLTIGSAQHIVFTTDYTTYAGVVTCQKVTVANRLAAIILSRIPSLDKTVVDTIRGRISSFGIDTKDLSVIDHLSCPERG